MSMALHNNVLTAKCELLSSSEDETYSIQCFIPICDTSSDGMKVKTTKTKADIVQFDAMLSLNVEKLDTLNSDEPIEQKIERLNLYFTSIVKELCSTGTVVPDEIIQFFEIDYDNISPLDLNVAKLSPKNQNDTVDQFEFNQINGVETIEIKEKQTDNSAPSEVSGESILDTEGTEPISEKMVGIDCVEDTKSANETTDKTKTEIHGDTTTSDDTETNERNVTNSTLDQSIKSSNTLTNDDVPAVHELVDSSSTENNAVQVLASMSLNPNEQNAIETMVALGTPKETDAWSASNTGSSLDSFSDYGSDGDESFESSEPMDEQVTEQNQTQPAIGLDTSNIIPNCESSIIPNCCDENESLEMNHELEGNSDANSVASKGSIALADLSTAEIPAKEPCTDEELSVLNNSNNQSETLKVSTDSNNKSEILHASSTSNNQSEKSDKILLDTADNNMSTLSQSCNSIQSKTNETDADEDHQQQNNVASPSGEEIQTPQSSEDTTQLKKDRNIQKKNNDKLCKTTENTKKTAKVSKLMTLIKQTIKLVALRQGIRVLHFINTRVQHTKSQTVIFGTSLFGCALASLLNNWWSKSKDFTAAWAIMGASGSVFVASRFLQSLLVWINKQLKTNQQEVNRLSQVTGVQFIKDDLEHDCFSVASSPVFQPTCYTTKKQQVSIEPCTESNETGTTAVENIDEASNEVEHETKDDNTAQYEALVQSKEYSTLFTLVKDELSHIDAQSLEASCDCLCWNAIAARLYGVSLKEMNQDATDILTYGLTCAERAVQFYPENYHAHKWLAILAEENSRGQGTKAKIQGGIRFYNHTKAALHLNPNDATLHYMMGKFQFAVASLSWMERKLARSLFGAEPPQATVEESIDSFIQAGNLRENGTPSCTDLLEIARGYKVLRKKQLAKEYLVACCSKETTDDDELKAKTEAKDMLNDL